MIIDYLPSLLLVWLGLIVGLLTPGASFLIIVNHALENRVQALWIALGCAFGTFFWALATSLGLSALIIATPNAINVIQAIGACYLWWMAAVTLKPILKGKDQFNLQSTIQADNGQEKPFYVSLLMGLMVHLTNPKAAFVWISLTSLLMAQDTPIHVVFIMVFISFILSWGWHSFLAIGFSSKAIRLFYERQVIVFKLIFSCAFILIGLAMIWQAIFINHFG